MTAVRPERPLARAIGRQLANRRIDLGYSRAEMARRVGVARPTIVQIEEGRANPTLARLLRYATGYGLTLDVIATAPAPVPVDEAAA